MPRFLTDKESAEVTSLLLRITSVSSLSKMSIRASNTEPKLDLTSSDNPGRIVSSPLLDEWTIILLHLALVTKSLSSRKKKLGSKDSTARFSAMNNLLDRLYWVGRKEVISRGEDRLSLLPESLLCHILSFLTTREAVCTSVLSSSWRNLWQWVPRLELDMFDFPNDKACVGFINKFLLNVKSLSEFNLTIDAQDASLYEPRLDKVSKRKIQQFDVECSLLNWTPLTLPACEELVSLKLFAVRLNDFESLSLPCLKTLYLAYVTFPHNAVFDTPRLDHLSLKDYRSNSSFKIVGMPASVKVHIDVFPLRDGELYNLLHKFLAVGDMTLSLATLESIYFFHDMNPRTEFTNLSRLRATMRLEYDCLGMLPFVLEMCPNLKHLTLELVKDVNTKTVAMGRRKVRSVCLVSSLEYVEIESPITKEAKEREVVKYFLSNVTSLKKLVLRLNVSRGEKHDLELLKQRFDTPKRSSLCQFEVVQKKESPFGFELLHCGLSERKIIDNLLNKFLAVRDMTLSQNTLLLLYYLHDTYPRPEFRNLSRLRSTMCLQDSLELLPFVLESCPSMKNLTLILVKDDDPEAETACLSRPLSFCLVRSLEYVEIEGPITEEATEQEVVKYILGNGRSLKKLVLRLNVSDGEKHDLELLKQRFDSPRRSSSCQFEVLLVVQTPEKIKCGSLLQSIRRTLSLFSLESVLDFFLFSD